jgi:DNA-binding SARP family transcriptional activator
MAPLGDDGRTLLHVRPGAPRDRRRRTVPHWVAGAQLRIYTLGDTRIMSRESQLGGRWLSGRPGQILRLLVTERRRVVRTDEIVEAIWPGSEMSTGENVRYFVHRLREQLEPEREKRARSSFVVSEHGGYKLDLDNVWIDAMAFEASARRGMSALARGERSAASALLNEALGLYEGDFLGDEPYAPWVLPERDRLRNLASDGLRELANLCIRDGQLETAAKHIARLAEMQPFDEDIQRRNIAVALALGRRSDAMRRYRALQERIQASFDDRAGFELTDVSPDEIYRS